MQSVNKGIAILVKMTYNETKFEKWGAKNGNTGKTKLDNALRFL